MDNPFNHPSFERFPDVRMIGELNTPDFVKRHPKNPILTCDDVPYDSDLVMNCSVVEHDGKLLMFFRNDYFPEKGVDKGVDTNIGLAESQDGINWTVRDKPVFSYKTDEIKRIYDPRVVVLDDRFYLSVCAPTPNGCRAATFVSDDLESFELINMALPESRNTVYFPEKIDGKYWRLERPFWDCPDRFMGIINKWVGPYFNIWGGSSPDMRHWGDYEILLRADEVNYSNYKIGPGGAPIKTDRGWLHLIHGVDWDPERTNPEGWAKGWNLRYSGGVMLTALDEPLKVIGYSREPFITPEVEIETVGGFRNNVIFPMSGIVQGDDLLIYYGVSDTYICAATAPISGLLDMCESV